MYTYPRFYSIEYTFIDLDLTHLMQEGDIVTVKPGSKPLPNSFDYEEHSIQVPGGSIWVEGDNRFSSQDSRHHGPITTGLVTYRVVAQIFPDFKRLYNPWLVRLLNANVMWRPGHAPSMQGSPSSPP